MIKFTCPSCKENVHLKRYASDDKKLDPSPGDVVFCETCENISEVNDKLEIELISPTHISNWPKELDKSIQKFVADRINKAAQEK